MRRKHVFEDALHRFKSGLDLKKHVCVTFVGEGGPLREFLFLLMGQIARNNSLLCGSETKRVPQHNMHELGKRTYYFIGMMIAASLIHSGPAPAFFTGAVADYIVYGKVKAAPEDVPDNVIREKLRRVCETLVCRNTSKTGYRVYVHTYLDHNE